MTWHLLFSLAFARASNTNASQKLMDRGVTGAEGKIERRAPILVLHIRRTTTVDQKFALVHAIHMDSKVKGCAAAREGLKVESTTTVDQEFAHLSGSRRDSKVKSCVSRAALNVESAAAVNQKFAQRHRLCKDGEMKSCSP
eukprot:Rhum_TRINITY_DN14757_c1_g5::Rhum_TRINITY_DN14757_c1_g5_i1::g.113542::m.113542